MNVIKTLLRLFAPFAEFATFLENELYDHLFRNLTYTDPVTVYAVALFFYGAFTGTLWGFAGVVAIVGAQLRLLRRRARRGYGVRITTRAGSKIAYAARDRTLVEDVAAAVREAIASVTDAPAPPRSARGRRRR